MDTGQILGTVGFSHAFDIGRHSKRQKKMNDLYIKYYYMCIYILGSSLSDLVLNHVSVTRMSLDK